MSSVIRMLLPTQPGGFRVLWWPLHIVLVITIIVVMIIGNSAVGSVATMIWLSLFLVQFVIDVYFGSERFQYRVSEPSVAYDPETKEIRRVFTSYYSEYLWMWDTAIQNTIFLPIGKHTLSQTAKAQFIDNITGRYPRYRQLAVTIKVGTNLSPEDAVAFYEATQLSNWKESASTWLTSQFQLFLDRCDTLAEIRDPVNDQARLEQIIREEFGPVLTERWGPYLQIQGASFAR